MGNDFPQIFLNSELFSYEITAYKNTTVQPLSVRNFKNKYRHDFLKHLSWNPKMYVTGYLRDSSLMEIDYSLISVTE